MISLLLKLFNADSHLSSLEKIILGCVRNGLDDTTASYWDKQVNSINKVQRLPKGIEVDFYRMKNGKPSFNKGISFQNKTQELKVAEVFIELPNISKTLRAEVWCVNGFLALIEYNIEPIYFIEAANMNPRPKFSLALKMINDLSKPTCSQPI